MSPFDEGFAAGTNDHHEARNPYAEGTGAHTEWEQGFERAEQLKEARSLAEEK